MKKKLIAYPPIFSSSFQNLDNQRFDVIHLYESAQDRLDNKDDWKYELKIVDRKVAQSKHKSNDVAVPSAVFLVPRGRESEYMFSTRKGLRNSIAKSANCFRLIAVSFSTAARNSSSSKDFIYINQEYIQMELEKFVQILAKFDSSDIDVLCKNNMEQNQKIPFIAISNESNGIGKKPVIIASGSTDTTGPFVVEQVEDPNSESSLGLYIRRLYFEKSPQVIQSEIYVRNVESDDKDNRNDTVSYEKLRLAFDYHKHISAGLMNFFHQLENETNKNHNILVVGVGGGGLLNFLQAFLCFNGEKDNKNKITAIELDENIFDIAQSHFGLEATRFDPSTENKNHDHNINVIIGDGLSLRPKEDKPCSKTSDNHIHFEPSSFTSIIIDVDSKDNTVGMSCPPVQFISISYLNHLKSLLTENGGILAINVSARDQDMLRMVKQNVKQVFSSEDQDGDRVFISSNTVEEEFNDDDEQEVDTEDLNIVLFARKGQTTSTSISNDSTKTKGPQFSLDQSKKDFVQNINTHIKSIVRHHLSQNITEIEKTKSTKLLDYKLLQSIESDFEEYVIGMKEVTNATNEEVLVKGDSRLTNSTDTDMNASSLKTAGNSANNSKKKKHGKKGKSKGGRRK